MTANPEQSAMEKVRWQPHKWVRVGPNTWECSRCGCEIEGYGECLFACVAASRLEAEHE